MVCVRSKGNWTGDRKQTTLWSISSKDQDAETVHGTQKSVECMRRPIMNNTSPGGAVYEPFLGSGTTLIAAESVGRTCFAVELSPAYVAVRRWQAFTGRKAIRPLGRPSLRRDCRNDGGGVMRGRRPKPTRLKILTGNPGKRPLNHDEPQPEAAIRIARPS